MDSKIEDIQDKGTLLITDEIERRADEAGIKLELIGGIPIWEASPVIRHQQISDRIRASIRAPISGEGCDCIHYADIYILFPDGSIKRPDISIFCSEPEEQDTMCRTIPVAVVEILSRGYEKKDTEVSLPLYLSYGIPDIILFDPSTKLVSHYQNGVFQQHTSPKELIFTTGCSATI